MAIFRLYIITTMTTEKTPNENLVYLCKICEFSSLKYSDFERHMSTNKHNSNSNSNNNYINNNSLTIGNKRVLNYQGYFLKSFYFPSRNLWLTFL